MGHLEEQPRSAEVEMNKIDLIEDDPIAGPLIVRARAEAMESKNVIGL